jgi:transposase
LALVTIIHFFKVDVAGCLNCERASASHPPKALAKIERLLARLELVLAQIAELERERDEVAAADAPDRAGKMIQQLASLRGIGVQSATALVREAL